MKRAPGLLKAALAILCLAASAAAQPNLAGSAEIQLALDRLKVNGATLMIAAHPDDENTALLAWLARGRYVRTAYLSLTRGEGGQNLIGPEQGRFLGLIRTQELLAARRIDGAQQFFTRAVDFGFSKSVEETLEKWNHEKTLSDVVWVIRKFRPDVIILRFSGTPRDGHGHHQTSAILGKEAYFAAADPRRFPEQLEYVRPWKAKRVVWNVFSWNREQELEAAKMPGRIEVDLGDFNPILGYSYSEIAGMSRSQHRSQGMGSPERRGAIKNFLVHVAGDPAQSDLLDGVKLDWPEPLAGILGKAAAEFDPRHPEKSVPLLLKARKLVPEERRDDVDEAIALCTGLWLDASTARPAAIPGTKVRITVQALNRSPLRVQLVATSIGGPAGKSLEYNRVWTEAVEWTAVEASEQKPLRDQPEAQPVLNVRFDLRVAGEEISLLRPVWHRYVDKIRGELTRPFVLTPPVSVGIAPPTVIFAERSSKTVDVRLRAYAGNTSGTASLRLPEGWQVQPASHPFELTSAGQETTLKFEVLPPAKGSIAKAEARATAGGKELSTDVLVIDYPHIDPQTLYEPAAARLVRADVKVTAQNVGYIMGAGDDIPEALRQIGCTVTMLTPENLAQSDLGRFDAIVTGVRAYNTRPDLIANQHRLLEYVRDGGTLVVQYNVLEREGLSAIGPYPIRIGRDRVTREDSPVEFLKPDHPLLRFPNKITAEDFEGWVQERGLYFASEWDPKYETVIAAHDPGEKPLPGGIVYTRYGKGAYVFTAYSWFRELPAGVPGAYRIFANLLSAGDAP